MSSKRDWFKITLYAASVITLVFGLWGGLKESLYLLYAIIATGVILFYANLDRISEFKATGKGIEAKTRIAIQEVGIATKVAQNMTKIMGEAIVSLTCRTGRLSTYYTVKELEERKDMVSELLRQIGSTDGDLKIVLREYWRYMKFDYVIYIMNYHNIPSSLSEENKLKWSKFNKQMSIDALYSPEQLQSFFEEIGQLSEEAKERISDYKYFIEHESHRRPNIFFDRDNWEYMK
jgi:hypothetical protein